MELVILGTKSLNVGISGLGDDIFYAFNSGFQCGCKATNKSSVS
jgi:hypothetical protein